MPEFKVVVSDGSESCQVEVKGHHANSLVGKKIGDEVDGIFVSLPGYKLKITGGSDKDGFVMRRDIPGISRRRILITKSGQYHRSQHPPDKHEGHKERDKAHEGIAKSSRGKRREK